MASVTKTKTGGFSGSYIQARGFGFALAPSSVDGILVSFTGADGATDHVTVGLSDYANHWIFAQTYHYIAKDDWNAESPSTGGATDKWGLNLAYTNINPTNFGIMTSGQYTNVCDTISITIYYTPFIAGGLFFGNG